MKRLFFIVLLLFPLPGLAEIYKCKDSRQEIVYQDTPCAAKTLGMVKPVPAPSNEDITQARRNLDRMIQSNRYYEQKQQAEWEKKQEALRLLEAQERREQDRMAAEAERDAYWPYFPLYGPGYGHRRHAHPPRHHDPVMPVPRRERPCVIGFIGDKGCH